MANDPVTENEPGEGSGAGFVRAGLLFYGAMAIVAVLWRMGFYREDLLYASETPLLDPWRDLGLGLAVGAGVVVVSNVATRATRWGEALGVAMAEVLSRLTVPEALLLAMASGLAEEMFFRGALQPRVGWLAASVLFGLLHFVPRREFYPWTVFALVVGLGLGALFEATGNLVAPVVAHVFINAVNMPILIRRYGGAAR